MRASLYAEIVDRAARCANDYIIPLLPNLA